MKHIGAVIDLLDLTQAGPARFRGPTVRHHPAAGRLFGGHLVAQALRAAALTLPEGRRPHSLHAYFLHPGGFDASVDYSVTYRRDGGAFSVRHVVGEQSGQAVIEMHVSGSIPFDDPIPTATPPGSPLPESLATVQESLSPFTDELDGWWVRERPFELRYVNDPPRLAAESARPSGRTSQVWVRAIGDVPDDIVLHQCLLAYVSDMPILDPVVAASPTVARRGSGGLASLDHSMWFHGVSDVTQWLHYTQTALGATSRRALALGEICDAQGCAIASIGQEGLLRPGPV